MTTRRLPGPSWLPDLPSPLAGLVPALPDPDSYEPMSALDASFLHAEGPRTPLHIGAVLVFEGAPFFDDRGAFRLEAVRRRVSERLHLFPRFRKRVAEVPFGLGRPVWVDDDRFDIANHVRLMALPPPGSRDQLLQLAEELQMRLLDRSHPLWELWFVGGLDDGNVAMVEKVHHAMVDGVSGVEVAAALLDLVQRPEPAEVPAWEPVPPPSAGALLAAAPLEWLRQPTRLVQDLGAMVGGVDGLRRRIEGVGESVGMAVRPHAVASTSLNQPVGGRRTLRSVTVPLDEVKRVGSQFDATVNDVVLGAVAGGVRALLDQRGEHPDRLTMQALVPVSIRSDEEHLALGNRVTAIMAPLPVDQPSAIERLGAARDAMRTLKGHHQAEGAELILEGIEVLPPAVLAAVAPVIHRQPLINVVVTNIPGPPTPLYFLGAEMLESVPVVPLGGNLTVGIAILSYRGGLTLGFHADADACPDLDVFAEAVAADLDLLFALHQVHEEEGEPLEVP